MFSTTWGAKKWPDNGYNFKLVIAFITSPGGSLIFLGIRSFYWEQSCRKRKHRFHKRANSALVCDVTVRGVIPDHNYRLPSNVCWRQKTQYCVATVGLKIVLQPEGECLNSNFFLTIDTELYLQQIIPFFQKVNCFWVMRPFAVIWVPWIEGMCVAPYGWLRLLTIRSRVVITVKTLEIRKETYAWRS